MNSEVMLKDLLLEPRLDTLREREGGEREERGGEEREGGERGGGVNYYLSIHYVHVFSGIHIARKKLRFNEDFLRTVLATLLA